MTEQVRAERFDFVQKSANALGVVAWLAIIFGVVVGSVAANGGEGDSSAALTFALACGPFAIASAGFMIARAVMVLAGNTLLDD